MIKHNKLPKLDLNITNRCNFRCVHCAFDSGITQMSELSLKDLDTILKDTKDLGGEKIDITGGEPTFRENYEEVIKLGKKHGYRIELVTNGSLLTKAKLLELRKLGLNGIAVSLDGSNYDVYTRIRKVSEEYFNNALNTIKNSVDIGFYTKVNTLASKLNMKDIPNIADFCIDTKVDELGIYYFTPVGRGALSKKLVIDPVEWLNFLRNNLVQYDSKINMSIEVPIIEKEFPKKGLGCILHEDPYHLQILPDGNTYPCAIMASYMLNIENLHDVSVKDIWNNQEIWKKNHEKIKPIFDQYKGFCVDFSDYVVDMNKYKMVCPLRKFRVGELK